MKSDLVLEDLAADVTLKCITEHPGFNPVCLQKWSLRLAAAKFKTKGKQQYRQNGSEERLVTADVSLCLLLDFGDTARGYIRSFRYTVKYENVIISRS